MEIKQYKRYTSIPVIDGAFLILSDDFFNNQINKNCLLNHFIIHSVCDSNIEVDVNIKLCKKGDIDGFKFEN